MSITLKVCNALKNEGAVIIPTNSTFDTTMKDDFISAKSLQGQYQIKYYKERLTQLDKFIEDGLKGINCIKINDGRTTKTKRYPIGTVSRVSEENKKRAYFLVDSDINERGIPENVDVSDIAKALVGLWDSLVTIGNKDSYSIPLLGTGRAGVKNASRDEVVKEIVISFLAATREHKITEELIICIHPSDFEKIHWDDLCDFIRFQCTFADQNRSGNTVGREETTSGKAVLKVDDVDFDFDFGEVTVINEDENGNKGGLPDRFGTMGLIENENNSKKNNEIILSILNGNQLNVAELSEAMGLSVNSTRKLVKDLVEKGEIQMIGDARVRKYTKA